MKHAGNFAVLPRVPETMATTTRSGGASSAAARDGMSAGLTFVFALACGAMAANLYFSQALITVISPALGLHAGLAGLIVTLTQLGYAVGVVLLVSLADLMENRRLILMCVGGTIAGLIGASLSTSAATFLLASFVVGVCASGAQIIVPFSAHLATDASRGKVIGNVMAGLVTGIMLARPVANLITSAFGWRAVFGASAVFLIVIGIVLWFALPHRRPQPGISYGGILASTWHLFATNRVLQRRTAYQAILFGVFNLFWTAVPIVLTQRFGFDQREIALFALAGAGGAIAAPIAGRLADRGFTRVGTACAMGIVIVAFLFAGWPLTAAFFGVLVVCAIAIDFGMQANLIFTQRVIYNLDPSARGRINAVLMTNVFIAGSAFSLLSSATYFYGGWITTMLTGVGFSVLCLVLYATEALKRPTAA